jgi:hypothetical protein
MIVPLPSSRPPAILGKQFATLDLDVEGLFQAEHDVEEIDRLGVQVALQRRCGYDFLVFHAQRVDERLLHLGKDLFFRRRCHCLGFLQQSVRITGPPPARLSNR